MNVDRESVEVVAAASRLRSPGRGTPRIVRFLVVGVVNTSISYGIYAGLVFLGWHYAAANLVAMIIGVIVGFRTTGRFVFHSRDNRKFGKYVVAWTALYMAATGITGVMFWVTGSAYAAGALAIPPAAVLSYLIQSTYVFGSHDSARDEGQLLGVPSPPRRREPAS